MGPVWTLAIKGVFESSETVITSFPQDRFWQLLVDRVRLAPRDMQASLFHAGQIWITVKPLVQVASDHKT